MILRIVAICFILWLPQLTSSTGKHFGPETAVQLSDCRWQEIVLNGKVQFVESFPDIKIQFVESFPDIRVKYVDAFPDQCGEWKIVDAFPDFKVQVVDAFPDIKVKVVNAFPGMED